MRTFAERTRVDAILLEGGSGEALQRSLWFHAFRQIRAAVRLRDTGRIAQRSKHRCDTFAARTPERVTGLHLGSRSRLTRLLAIEPRNRREMRAPAVSCGFRSAAFEVGGRFGIVWRPHVCFLRRAGARRDNLEQFLKNLGNVQGEFRRERCVRRRAGSQ